MNVLGQTSWRNCTCKNFNDYVKYLPSVSYQQRAFGPGFALIYMRGVASGGNSNHSGSQPSVGVYLDEQPVTTIQGPLDIHMYDIARVEALAGPQGTLYGASAQAGALRIITNKPDPSGFAASYSARHRFGRSRRHWLYRRGHDQHTDVDQLGHSPGRLART